MYSTNNTIKVLIGKSINETATPSIDPQSASFIADGEVVILANNKTTDEEEVYPTGYSAGGVQPKYVRFAQNSGGRVHYSPRIKTKNITRVSRAAYAGPADQVDFVGFDTSSGTIEELDNNEYMLHITYRHDDKMWSEQLNKRTYVYYSGDNTSALTVAADFVKQINSDAYTAVKANIVTNGTFTGTGQNVTVTNGSKTIVFAGAITIPSNSYIKLGANSTSAPVYFIKNGATGTTFTLDTPWQDTTATILAANNGLMTAVTTTGIKLTGLTLDYVGKGLKPYNRVQFEIAIVGFGTTTITNARAVVFGNGLGKQVADLEWFALGGDGIRNFMWHPVPTGRTDANELGTYYTYAVEYFNDDDQYVISGTKPAKGLVYIFFELPLTATEQYDIFQAKMVTYSL